MCTHVTYTPSHMHTAHTLTYAHTPSHMHTHIPFLDLAPTFSFDGHRISVPVSSMMCIKYCSALSLPYPPTKGGRRGRGREGEGEGGRGTFHVAWQGTAYSYYPDFYTNTAFICFDLVLQGSYKLKLWGISVTGVSVLICKCTCTHTAPHSTHTAPPQHTHSHSPPTTHIKNKHIQVAMGTDLISISQVFCGLWGTSSLYSLGQKCNRCTHRWWNWSVGGCHGGLGKVLTWWCSSFQVEINNPNNLNNNLFMCSSYYVLVKLINF